MEEHTFTARCDLCHKQDRACRNHHLIPMRLLNILPKNTYLRWFKQTIVVCSSCNNFIHPENKLYGRINFLEEKCGFRITDYKEYEEAKRLKEEKRNESNQ